MSETILITTSVVPANFCFTNWQASWPQLVSLLSGTLLGNTNTFNFGNTKPSAANEDKPWLRTDSVGRPDKWYVFYSGFWLSPVSPYDLNERRIFVGTENNQVWFYDGGDGTDPGGVAPTLYTGAMWEVDTSLAAKFPVGVGTFPVAGAVTVNGTGGEEQHILTIPEIPAHTHDVKIIRNTATDTNESTVTEGDPSQTVTWTSEATGGGQAHNTLPPYYGVYFIKRTARMFYTAP